MEHTFKKYESSYERIHDAKVILERNGYQTANLWNVFDVQELYDTDSDTAMELLVEVMEHPCTIEHIWGVLKDVAEDNYKLKSRKL
jgi:hypothetical protein|tara:strand:- start:12303 stop:12560 length:258 start_codon:yes stop_codon:yes gene_type:complete